MFFVLYYTSTLHAFLGALLASARVPAAPLCSRPTLHGNPPVLPRVGGAICRRKKRKTTKNSREINRGRKEGRKEGTNPDDRDIATITKHTVPQISTQNIRYRKSRKTSGTLVFGSSDQHRKCPSAYPVITAGKPINSIGANTQKTSKASLILNSASRNSSRYIQLQSSSNSKNARRLLSFTTITNKLPYSSSNSATALSTIWMMRQVPRCALLSCHVPTGHGLRYVPGMGGTKRNVQWSLKTLSGRHERRSEVVSGPAPQTSIPIKHANYYYDCCVNTTQNLQTSGAKKSKLFGRMTVFGLLSAKTGIPFNNPSSVLFCSTPTCFPPMGLFVADFTSLGTEADLVSAHRLASHSTSTGGFPDQAVGIKHNLVQDTCKIGAHPGHPLCVGTAAHNNAGYAKLASNPADAASTTAHQQTTAQQGAEHRAHADHVQSVPYRTAARLRHDTALLRTHVVPVQLTVASTYPPTTLVSPERPTPIMIVYIRYNLQHLSTR